MTPETLLYQSDVLSAGKCVLGATVLVMMGSLSGFQPGLGALFAGRTGTKQGAANDEASSAGGGSMGAFLAACVAYFVYVGVQGSSLVFWDKAQNPMYVGTGLLWNV